MSTPGTYRTGPMAAAVLTTEALAWSLGLLFWFTSASYLPQFRVLHLAENASIWFGAVLRGDTETLTIGKNSNVQDNAMLHSDYDCPITLGERVSIGHNAVVHGATIENDVTVGMHATVLNGAVLGAGSMIAAGALVKEHTVIPPCSLVVGVPGSYHTDEDLGAGTSGSWAGLLYGLKPVPFT